MDVLNPEQRKKNMQANKSTGTYPELLLSKALWKRGYRYRKNYKPVTGKPDLAFVGLKVAVFIDGEFWHGKDWDEKKEKITANKTYWIPKIEKNMARDLDVKYALQQDGWIVLRFWSKDVVRNFNDCLTQVIETLETAKHHK